MKERKLYYLLYLFIAATFVFFNVGCSEDEDPITPPVTIVESEELVNICTCNDNCNRFKCIIKWT